jgi:hypothetical protein
VADLFARLLTLSHHELARRILELEEEKTQYKMALTQAQSCARSAQSAIDRVRQVSHPPPDVAALISTAFENMAAIAK